MDPAQVEHMLRDERYREADELYKATGKWHGLPEPIIEPLEAARSASVQIWVKRYNKLTSAWLDHVLEWPLEKNLRMERIVQRLADRFIWGKIVRVSSKRLEKDK